MTELGALLQFLVDHPKIFLLFLSWYVFNVLASSLPKPADVAQVLQEKRPIFTMLIYPTIFHAAQSVAGNWARFVPQLQLQRFLNGGKSDEKNDSGNHPG